MTLEQNLDRARVERERATQRLEVAERTLEAARRAVIAARESQWVASLLVTELEEAAFE